MARNAELVRQWEILRAIDGARNGIAIAKLAADRDVHPRTIRRDIDALGRAGFPLYDEKVNGTSMWKLRAKPFRSLEHSGMGVTELGALYFGRAVLTALTGPIFESDADRALLKVERATPLASRKAVEQLPRVLNAKKNGRKKQDERKLREVATRALDAITRQRCVTMRYASASTGRTKDYAVEPQRLSYADGGVYLTAWVPDYGQLRTFAMERIETLALSDDRFEPRPLPIEPFSNSLGVHSGPAESIAIEFTSDAANYVQSREWHRSQQIEERADGSVLLRLEVCNDCRFAAGSSASARRRGWWRRRRWRRTFWRSFNGHVMRICLE
ncbi:MAG: WYL domain-containing protein [Acidobacteria bacterium]|nr:WYL domain-containing protein [Acidobacteriota bacterium]MCA1650106.1 WYL domain-containing protein [Acidobacteriota bacterium]